MSLVFNFLKVNDNVKNSFQWKQCCPNELKTQYLEKKFDELILKRFNLVPGFNDLFIFTPGQCTFLNDSDTKKLFNLKKANLIDDDAPSKSLEFNEKEYTYNIDDSDEDNNDDEYNRHFDDRLDEDEDAADSDELDEDEDEDDEYCVVSNPIGRLNRDEESVDTQSDEPNNEEANSGEIENSDELDTIEIFTGKMDKNGVLNYKKIGKKRLKSKFKSSSPFSNPLDLFKQVGLENIDKKELNSNPGSPITDVFYASNSEQIIGIEFVCIIGNEFDLGDSETLERRTRTTTLCTR